jgi:hypothetical protein
MLVTALIRFFQSSVTRGFIGMTHFWVGLFLNEPPFQDKIVHNITIGLNANLYGYPDIRLGFFANVIYVFHCHGRLGPSRDVTPREI